MAKNDAIKRQAEMMFVELGMTAKDIAEQLNVEPKTVGRWRNGSVPTWDVKRQQLLASPHKIKELLRKELLSVLEGNAPTIKADDIIKLTNSLDKIDDKINPRVVLSVIKMLDEFLADINPQLASASLNDHKKFILHIIEMHG